MRTYFNWTPEELAFLRENYSTADKRLLISKLRNRKWLAINKKAENLGLSRTIAKYNDLSALCQETAEAYYWLGFLLADGSFTDRQIQIAVAEKDLAHLRGFQNFVKSTNTISKVGKNYFRLKVSSIREIKSLKDKFLIHSNKTHNPCRLPLDKGDLMFALFVGFFDGDGCLYKVKTCNSYALRIVGYHAWLENFEAMGLFLQNYFSYKLKARQAWTDIKTTNVPGVVEKKQYLLANFSITDRTLIRKIVQRARDLRLPILERKLGQLSLTK